MLETSWAFCEIYTVIDTESNSNTTQYKVHVMYISRNQPVLTRQSKIIKWRGGKKTGIMIET